MWHEARKQERIIRGMIVDYRRRAERRKDFYEKIKAEPTQFLQLHGRQCKIHLDPAIAAAGEGPAIMMPWQGDTSNMIDRFDVRAHLDIIPEVKAPDIPPEDLIQEERHCNYERYRILAQNAFLGISEDKFLQQLAIEEQFGVTVEEKESHREKLSEKKGIGAAIGYNYNDPGAQPSCFNGPDLNKKVDANKDSDDDSDLEIIDVDLSIDVNKMEASQAHELNAVGPQYGMAGCDLFSFLTGDADDAEHQKQLLREEKEKAMFSGRKSRRERRAHRDKKLATRVMSPPSYAAPSSFEVTSRSPSRSPSRTPSPEHATIEFITSFGPDEEEKPSSMAPKPLYADKLKQNLKKPDMLYSEAVRKLQSRTDSKERTRQYGPRWPDSRSRSRSGSRPRSRSRSPRSRSKSSRSRSKSYSSYQRTRSRSRSRSRSKSRSYRARRSRSTSNIASGFANRNRSRSMSDDSNDKSNTQSKPVPRYYGRRKEDKSSSELSLDSDTSESLDDEKNKSTVGNKSNTNPNQLRLTGSSSKGASRETVTMKERLKRKMQAQLSRQLRADKRAEAARRERESRRQARRDEEMRELAIKLRRKQREMRHQRCRRSSEEDTDSDSDSSSRQSPDLERKREDRSRSKSKPPDEKRVPVRIPVWENDKFPSSPTPSYRPNQPEVAENSYYNNIKRRYDNPEVNTRDDRRGDDREQNSYQNRHDRYQNRESGRNDNPENYSRSDSYESRFEQERQGPSWRRPYTQRDPYRSQNVRTSGQSQDGPSSRYRDDEREGSSSRSKVKLVDY